MENFTVTRAERVYVYSEPVNMGMSFGGLTKLVEKKIKRKATSGDLYMFFNKKRTYIKIMFWRKNGMCIFAKRLAGSYFDTEAHEGSTISVRDMQGVIDELQVGKIKEIAAPSRLSKAINKMNKDLKVAA